MDWGGIESVCCMDKGPCLIPGVRALFRFMADVMSAS